MIANANNMLISKILDVLINMNNSMTSTNTAIIKQHIGTWRTYRTIVDEVVVVVVVVVVVGAAAAGA